MIQQPAHIAQPVTAGTYGEDFTWQERFIPEIASIVGWALLRPAPQYLDRNKNVDLVLRFDAFTGVACRVRRFPYLARFPDEITIRAARPSGAITELDKLDTCLTSHMFYGFANEHGDGLAAWTLLDLTVMRAWYVAYKRTMGREPGMRRSNPDGTEFIALDLNGLPSGVIIARRYPEPDEARWLA